MRKSSRRPRNGLMYGPVHTPRDGSSRRTRRVEADTQHQNRRQRRRRMMRGHLHDGSKKNGLIRVPTSTTTFSSHADDDHRRHRRRRIHTVDRQRECHQRHRQRCFRSPTTTRLSRDVVASDAEGGVLPFEGMTRDTVPVLLGVEGGRSPHLVGG